MIDDNDVAPLAYDYVSDFFGFAFADKGCGIGPIAATENKLAGFGAGRLHQLSKLFDFAVIGVTREAHMNQNGTLARSTRRRL